jgi:hypothetical protein
VPPKMVISVMVGPSCKSVQFWVRGDKWEKPNPFRPTCWAKPRGASPVAVSAPFARLRSPEGTEQLGKRLLHLIGRHRKPRLQQRLRGRCVDGACQAPLEFLHNHLLRRDDVGEVEEARASSGVQSTSTVTFMMRFLFAARPAIGGQDSEMGRSCPQAKRFRVRCWRSGGRFRSLKR